MNAFIWRALCALLMLAIVAQNLLLLRSRYQAPDPSLPSLPSQITESSSDKPAQNDQQGVWAFNVSRDADNYALDHEQCGIAFPKLYYEIDRAVSYRLKDTSPITVNDTSIDWRDDAAFRALIHNNQLRILETKGIFHNEGFRNRALSVLQQIHRALIGAQANGEKLPTIEFAVTVDDRSLMPSEENDSHAIWNFARKLADKAQDRVWVMPDFNFWAWLGPAGAFSEMRARAAMRDGFIIDKIPKAVWRGATWTNPPVRGGLLQRSKGKPWADIMEIDWELRKNMMPMEDFCRYAFVVHTEGRSWSGRLKYLLNCDSVPIVHKMEWTSHYYHLLVARGPDQNHIAVKRNFANLEKKMKHYIKKTDEAQRVADNAVAAFRDRYLTPAAGACYWRRLIRGWREASFEPELYEEVEVDVSGILMKERRMRGITFEEFILTSKEWPEPPEPPPRQKRREFG